MKLAADTTLLAMHATAILHLSCSRVALPRDDRRSILMISNSAHPRVALRSFELEAPAGVTARITSQPGLNPPHRMNSALTASATCYLGLEGTLGVAGLKPAIGPQDFGNHTWGG